ncbi:MAG: hypothetical protein KIT33_06320 [Candidatus Kapabacteria bacterium]|nr:hypothetical protein [Ignavibacteriota bacterium]MCW5884569.1 hypothetical protein [Candidatus Kapabacteria bacterium]
MTYNSYSQGCSDAGVCTMNSFKPNDEGNLNQTSNQIKFGISYGNADYSISALGNYIEYNKQINNKFGFDIKLTSIAQNGNDISKFGLSDAFLNINYKANEKIILTLGTKIPLSQSNITLNNLPLPMDYQASLGTYDLILGIGYELNKIQIVAALQQPLTQNNNQFLAEKYPTNSKLREFQSTNQFKRSGDVLLRVSYPVSLSEKIRVTPSILPIYHLYNDKFTNESGIEQEIADSKGLTLNGNIFLDYELNSSNIIQLNLGMPFVIRKERPDGLTRSFIANLEYRFKF